MRQVLNDLAGEGLATMRDVLPIIVVLFGFQVVVLRRPIPHLRQVLGGFALVLVGMTLFLSGLDEALFPLGELMARQLTDPAFVAGEPGAGGAAGAAAQDSALNWTDYGWVYLFGAMIGFATTVAEPALIAVSSKAHHVSGGTVNAWGLRVAVAVGVAFGIGLGTFRIVTGTPLHYYVIAGYVLVALQTTRAPRSIIALAFDTGGVTTSTVTVPLVAALGLGLASTIPGRSPILDGFGLIAFASLFPMMTVMAYAQIGQWRAARRTGPASGPAPPPLPSTPQPPPTSTPPRPTPRGAMQQPRQPARTPDREA